jgi:hypothetical protein
MKKPKIENMDLVLAKMPESDRPDLKKQLEKLFENFDPNNPPGRRVVHLPKDTESCPTCGGPLMDLDKKYRKPHSITMPDGRVLDMFECEACDIPYSMDAKS